MQLSDMLFCLLRFEFFGVELSQEEKNCLSGLEEEESKKLFALAKKHDLAPALASALVKNGLITKEDFIYNHYIKEQMLALYRYENQRNDLTNIKEVLSQNGVEFVALKGAIIREYYKDPKLRTSCDIDVLVRREDLEKTTQLLVEKLSYVTDKREYFHDVTLHTPSGVTVELHFSIEEGIKDLDCVLAKAWDYALTSGETEQEKLFTNEFLLFYLVAHTAYHFVNGGCGIKPFIDLQVLNNSVEFSQERLQDLLEDAGLVKFYHSITEIAKAWLVGGQKTDLVLETEEYILKGGVYGTTDNAIAVKRASDTSKTKYFWSRLFLPYDSLKVVFPILKKHKWLFPFCQVARWFKALFSGRGKKFKKELEVSSSITKEEGDKLSSLLKNIGLK